MEIWYAYIDETALTTSLFGNMHVHRISGIVPLIGTDQATVAMTEMKELTN